MGIDAECRGELRTIIDAVLRGDVSEAQAERVYELGRDAVTAFVLATAKRVAEMVPAPGPHTPPGSIPPYAKPGAKTRGRKKPGARAGHEGHRRPTPPPDERVEVEELRTCPECNGEVHPARRRRTRMIEDMPRDANVTATEYSIPSHWCPCCRKHVEPRVSAALPRCSIGNNLAAMTVVFHYGLGLTIDQTRDVLLSPLRTHVSAGGLAALWQRVAEVLLPWYERIGQEARHSAVLHADETGWRVNGQTHWLWCFCNDRTCYYMIDEGRGTGALNAFFTEAFGGVLIHDFWRPYGSVLMQSGVGGEGGEGVPGEHQCCLAHLLRELDHIDEKRLPRKGPDRAEEWTKFVKMLRRLIRDGVRLRRREDFTPDRYSSRIARIDVRLRALAEGEHADEDAARLAKRLLRHQDELFTFLDRPEADWNNNLAERMIRPAVILRKGSQCNRSDRGAATQAVLMTVYGTLKLRGLDPRQVIADALTGHAATGTLPSMPGVVESG
jgi:transposase